MGFKKFSELEEFKCLRKVGMRKGKRGRFLGLTSE